MQNELRYKHSQNNIKDLNYKKEVFIENESRDVSVPEYDSDEPTDH